MSTTYYQNYGVQSRPQRRRGGLLSSLLGNALGAGMVSEGGYMPEVDADALARERFAVGGGAGLDEEAAIDKWNAVKAQQAAQGVESRPASFVPYQLKNPFLTSLFNPELAGQLQERNAQGERDVWANEQRKAAERAAYDRQMALAQYEQGAQDNRQSATAEAARKQAQLEHDLRIAAGEQSLNNGVRQGIGVGSGVDIGGLNTHRLAAALNTAKAQADFTARGDYPAMLGSNMEAKLAEQALLNENRKAETFKANTVHTRPGDTVLYNAPTMPDLQVLPGSDIVEQLVPQYMDDGKGGKIQIGNETTRTIRPRSGYSVSEREAKKRALAEGGGSGVDLGGNGVRAITSKPAPVATKPLSVTGVVDPKLKAMYEAMITLTPDQAKQREIELEIERQRKLREQQEQMRNQIMSPGVRVY